ncbi:MAG: hypothetical protein RIR11_4311 [Bacteroidota bacterium]|jgi:hypothetical protein
MEDKILDPEASLLLIRQTIELAKRKVQENGFHLLLWGVLVVTAGLADFYHDLKYNQQHAHLAWMIMPLVGVPIALVYEMRRSKAITNRNTIHQWYGYIWLGYGITLPLLIVYALQFGVSPTPIVLSVTGFAIFVSGIILQFRPLVLGAVVIWAGALCCLFVPSIWYTLIMSISIAMGYLIPGYLLHRSKN